MRDDIIQFSVTKTSSRLQLCLDNFHKTHEGFTNAENVSIFSSGLHGVSSVMEIEELIHNKEYYTFNISKCAHKHTDIK